MNKNEAKLKAKRLTEGSKGDVKTKRLVNATKGIIDEKYGLADPLISHLPEGETVHFLFLARNKCPVIIYPNSGGGLFSSSREKPFSDDTVDGTKFSHSKKGAYFSLITDKRVALITGIHTSNGSSVGDEVFERTFDQITNVEINRGSTKVSMEIADIEGRKIKFWGQANEWEDMKRAKSYIQSRIIGSHSADSYSIPANPTRPAIDENPDFTDLDPKEFEYYVAEVWEKKGWNVEVTQASNDKGIDIIATKSDPFQQKQLIQAKQYSADNPVSSTDVQQYASLYQQEKNVDSVIIVTTSYFTSAAEDRAEDLNVKLIDGEGLARMDNRGS